MKNLLFVARVAFISNGFMLLAFLMRYVEIVKDKDLQSLVIIIGFLISFVFNCIAAIGLIVLLLGNQKNLIRPLWLFSVNFLCFIFQLYFLLK